MNLIDEIVALSLIQFHVHDTKIVHEILELFVKLLKEGTRTPNLVEIGDET
jgi:hypothetical protein